MQRPPGRSAPDRAAKIHLSLAPVYYHDCLPGEMAASRPGAAIRAERPAGGGAVADPAVGSLLRERVFARGATLPWTELLRATTGEPLSARRFIRDVVIP